MASHDRPDGRPVRRRPATAVVVESHDITLAGLSSVLASISGVDVTGQVSSLPDAIGLCRTLRPALIVSGLSPAGSGGVSVVSALRRASPSSRIIVLSTDTDPKSVVDAIQAGATAFLLKDAPSGALIAAVERVLAGEAFVDRTLAGQVIQAFAIDSAQTAFTPRPDPLTPRELQVLRSIAHGGSNKEIASDLQLAAGTVKIHVERILRKLAVSNRAEATFHAVRLGILDTEDDPAAKPVGRAPSR
ncbi:MAG TPA: response regulator transcription factor [Candidatus Limnocylindria bacterium]|nr:response regulator transcription factor [Candidatus Limnocylindria bacterium]